MDGEVKRRQARYVGTSTQREGSFEEDGGHTTPDTRAQAIDGLRRLLPIDDGFRWVG
jgi:hypothetical protein